MANPRGGQFAIDGFAQDNVSVRRVIYRVKFDITQTTNVLGGNAPTSNTLMTKAANGTYPTGTAGIVVIPGATRWQDHAQYAGMLGLWNDYVTNGSGVTSGGRTDNATVVTQDGWYMANLDESQLYAANMPWNFMLNASREITDLIAAKGFTYESSRMLRVWVEVLVFDGSAATAAGAFNRMSLGVNNINERNPRPYVREFYMTASEPSITTPMISNRLDTDTSTLTPADQRPAATLAYANYNITLTEDNVRGGRFGVRATLNSGGNTNINEIHVRLRGESASDSSNQPLGGWRPVYIRSDATPRKSVNGVTFVDNWSGGTAGDASARTATLTYAFSSTANATSTAQEIVRSGTWAKSGGNFTVDIRVRDSSTPSAEAIYTFEVGIDNFIPLADTTAKNTTPSKVAGTNVQFLGRVFDYQGSPNATTPPHRKIKEVIVWFTNQAGTSYIRMNDGGTGTQANAGAGTETTNIWTSQANTITWSTSNPNDVTNIALGTAATQANRRIPTTANYFKRINEASGSGTTWSPSKIGTAEDVYWSFVQDTTVLPDGWMKMHYVVVDQTNNRSYYTQDMLVCNNYPIITNITLYTNNTGEGAVFTSHDGNEAFTEYPIPTGVDGKTIPYASGYLNSGFISKNSVIGFGVDTIGTKKNTNGTPTNGNTNPSFKYQARFVERYLVPLTKTNLQAMAGAGVTAADGTVTRSLAHLPNTVYFNDAGNLVNSAGTPAATPTLTAAESGFLDLYTIATGNSGTIPGGDAVWRLLGVPSLTPKDGSHFVFQGINVTNTADPRYNADNNVNNMAGFPNV
jgi:hypothetical protein